MAGRVLAALCVAVFLVGCPTGTTTTTTTTTSTTTTTLGDVVAPSVPGAPNATPAGCGNVQIAWTASTDAGSGVLGYDVRRNGVLLPRVTAPSTTMMDGGLAAQTTFAYTVTAVDRAGNESVPSAPVLADVAQHSP